MGPQKHKHEAKNGWNALSEDGKVWAGKWLVPSNSVKGEEIQDCGKGWLLLQRRVHLERDNIDSTAYSLSSRHSTKTRNCLCFYQKNIFYLASCKAEITDNKIILDPPGCLLVARFHQELHSQLSPDLVFKNIDQKQ